MSDQKTKKLAGGDEQGVEKVDGGSLSEKEKTKIERGELMAEPGIETADFGKEKSVEDASSKIDEVRKAVSGSVSDEDDAKDDPEREDVRRSAEEVAAIQNAEWQVERIVQIAIMENPSKAIKVARELDSNYILDKVHDELVEDKVRKILIEKNLFEEM